MEFRERMAQLEGLLFAKWPGQDQSKSDLGWCEGLLGHGGHSGNQHQFAAKQYQQVMRGVDLD